MIVNKVVTMVSLNLTYLCQPTENLVYLKSPKLQLLNSLQDVVQRTQSMEKEGLVPIGSFNKLRSYISKCIDLLK